MEFSITVHNEIVKMIESNDRCAKELRFFQRLFHRRFISYRDVEREIRNAFRPMILGYVSFVFCSMDGSELENFVADDVIDGVIISLTQKCILNEYDGYVADVVPGPTEVCE